MRQIATRHSIVLIVDEIQTGFGRIGTIFAFEQAEIAPDLVTVAKSLAGGLPLSAVVGRAEIMDAPLPGGLGGTYGGNALACAAALAVLDASEQDGLLAALPKSGDTDTDAILDGRVDASIVYCSGRDRFARLLPDAILVQFPAALQVGPEYGLAVIKGAPPAASAPALRILLPERQLVLMQRGFRPVTLPAR